MKPEKNLILQLFLTFFKIGPTTFGGGYAMIPLIEREIVINKKWLKRSDVTDVFAIAESVPGAIAINSATFIGFRIAGWRGALASLFGILIPTFTIVIILSISFLYVQDNPIIESAFQGIRPTIVALITYAAYKIGQTGVYDKTTFITMIITVFLLLFLNVHPVLMILGGIGTGILLVKLKKAMNIKVKLERED